MLEEAETAIDEDLGKRPVLNEARRLLREGEADTLVIFKVDRVFRNQYQPAALLPELKAIGCGIEFTLERFEDTAIGRFSLQAVAFAAEMEHAAIRERTMRARVESVRVKGRMPPAPRPLYGYVFRKGKNNHGEDIIVGYDENPATARIVRRIYAEYLAGRTLRAIAQLLTTERVLCPSGKSTRWSYVSVRERLVDERYAGADVAWRHERRRTKNDKKGWRYRAPEDREALPEGTIPPLVERATWDACHARLATNKQAAARNNKRPTEALLRGGLVRCAYCRREDDPDTGRVMVVGNANAHRPALYRCVAMLADGRQCTNTILVSLLDGAVWAHVRALVKAPELVRAHFRQLATDDPTAGEAAGIAAALRDGEREVANLTANLGLVTGPAAAAVAAALQTKSEALESLKRQRDAIAGRRAVWTTQQARLAGAQAFLRGMRERLSDAVLDALAPADKQELVRLLGMGAEVRRPKEGYPNGLRYAVETALPGACDQNGLPFQSQRPESTPLILRWADHPPLGAAAAA
jgi:site-specific DNA recombinase